MVLIKKQEKDRIVEDPDIEGLIESLKAELKADEKQKAFVEKYGEGARHRPTLVIYPGARHSFDAKRPDRVYFGHRLAYDPTAAADAFERTRKFLDERMRRQPQSHDP